ncbi:ferrous iron transport protein A [Thiosocius teredinicola]|uniref:ferrous iron transport protein A n=1 Tax=Thiosocius teredinicola TaxID=1973002 RepID=UPI0009913173
MNKTLRLSDLEPGDDAVIMHASSHWTSRRLTLLGLIDGARLRLELRCRDGNLVVSSEDERFHIPARHAQQIWVAPFTG